MTAEPGTDLVPAPYRIPDGIEPVEGWRCWNWDGTNLVSLNFGVPWPAGQRMEATCQNHGQTSAVSATSAAAQAAFAAFAVPDKYRWVVGRSGWTRAEACHWLTYANIPAAILPSGPTVELPPGFGYQLEVEPPPPPPKHEVPVEQCSCGVYAVSDINLAPAGQVYGKVKMWGKVIEGERGFRAEFAYPSELWVSPGLLTDKGLLAYGVPLHDAADKDAPRKSPYAGLTAPITFGPGQWINVQVTGTGNRTFQWHQTSSTASSFGSVSPVKRRFPPWVWAVIWAAASGNLIVQAARAFGWL